MSTRIGQKHEISGNSVFNLEPEFWDQPFFLLCLPGQAMGTVSVAPNIIMVISAEQQWIMSVATTASIFALIVVAFHDAASKIIRRI